MWSNSMFNSVRAIKSGRMGQVGYLFHVGKIKNVYTICSRNVKQSSHLKDLNNRRITLK